MLFQTQGSFTRADWVPLAYGMRYVLESGYWEGF